MIFIPIYPMQTSFQYKTKLKHLDHVPELYYQFQNLPQAMEEVWQLVVCSTRSLTTDKDIIGDFCLYFYEKLPTCFEVYRKNSRAPFAPFLVKFLKFQFYNYIRHRRNRDIQESLHGELSFFSQMNDHSFISCSGAKEDKCNLDEALKNQPDSLRVLFKIYLGFELDITELKLLINKVECPKRVAEFMQESRLRKEKKREKSIKHQNYITHLNTLLFQEKTKQKTNLLQHKKRRIEKLLQRESNHTCEISRIARLLGVNKSTISRRITFMARHLKQAKK